MAIQAQFPAPLAATAQDFAVENCFVNNNSNGGGGGGGFDFFNTLEQQQQQLFQINLQQQLVLQQQQQQRNNNANHNNLLGNGNFAFETLNRSSNLNGVVVASPSAKTEVKSAAAMQSNMVGNPPLQSMAAFEQKQRQEIDHYIRLQNERLRMMLQEQRKQQLAVLLKSIESKATVLLQQKDDEISLVTKRATEMELVMKRLEMENQAWQRIAKENEAAVISLNNTLEQVRESSSLMMMVNHNNGEEDAESCCSGNDVNNKTDAAAGRVCKGCNSRGACVLFLPCRHLCSCNVCEGFLGSCPVCRTPKKASIEALMG